MRFLQVASVAIPVSIAVGVLLSRTDGLVAPLEIAAVSRAPDPECCERAAAVEAKREESVVAEAAEGNSDDDGDGDANADRGGSPDDDPRFPRQSVTLRGRVFDAETGGPIANASVSSARLEPATPTRTAADGTFEIEGESRETSSVRVIFAAPGFVPIDHVCDFDPETREANDLSIEIRRGCEIRGRVVLPAGIAAADVRLAVEYDEGNDLGDRPADPWSPDPDGSFVIDSVLPGALVVVSARVEDLARGATLPFWTPRSIGAVVAADVVLTARACCRIELTPHVDPPVLEEWTADRDESVGVVRLDCGERIESLRVPEEDGSFLFVDLPAGRYAASMYGLCRESRGGADGLPLGAFDVAAGEERVVEFTRPPCGCVTGDFIAADKTGLWHGCTPTSVALALEREGVRLRQRVDARGGRFCFVGVPPGRFKLTASVECEPLEVESGESDVVLREIGHGVVTVAVRCRAVTDRFEAVLSRADGRASGYAQDTRSVAFWTESPLEFEFESCGPGPLRLEIRAPGDRPLVITTRAPLAAETLDLGTFDLEAAEPMRGIVVDDRDRPLAGVRIRGLRVRRVQWRETFDEYHGQDEPETPAVTSDDAGRFELPFEPDLARCLVELSDSDAALVVPSASSDGLRLRVPPLRAIHGKLVTGSGSPVPFVCVRLARSSCEEFDTALTHETRSDERGRFTMFTRTIGLHELYTRIPGADVVLDAAPFTIGAADLDLGALVLRH